MNTKVLMRVETTPQKHGTARSNVCDVDSICELTSILDPAFALVTMKNFIEHDVTNQTQRVVQFCQPFEWKTATASYQEIRKHIESEKAAEALISALEFTAEIFCDLLDIKRVGIRLAHTRAAMCPQFHVDQVACRGVLTLAGTGTQWLREQDVDRPGLKPKVDASVQQLQLGEFALFKGAQWDSLHVPPIVHRSPCDALGRLVVTFDILAD
jgi:Protein of unknown function (DUF1826)